jgi:hypothetical protein
MVSHSSLVYYLFSKARSLPYSGAPERFFNRVGSCLDIRLGWKILHLGRIQPYSKNFILGWKG